MNVRQYFTTSGPLKISNYIHCLMKYCSHNMFRRGEKETTTHKDLEVDTAFRPPKGRLNRPVRH